MTRDTNEADGSVVVIGEALIDVVEQATASVEHVGGSPANVALGLGRLGVPVSLLTYLARDRRGQSVSQHLEASGVRVLDVSFSAQRTSTAVARIGNDGAADYTFDLEWDVSGDQIEESPTLVHTGSIGAFLQPGASTVLRHLQNTPAMEVSFDPNIRSALVGSRDEALGCFEAITKVATVVKMSDEDAEWLFPGASVDDVLDQVLARGPRLVAVTRGGDGAVLSTGAHRVPLPAAKTDVVDTIGAGDTFMASLISSVVASGSHSLTSDDLERMGAKAIRAAALTVSRAGADLPWSHEL